MKITWEPLDGRMNVVVATNPTQMLERSFLWSWEMWRPFDDIATRTAAIYLEPTSHCWNIQSMVLRSAVWYSTSNPIDKENGGCVDLTEKSESRKHFFHFWPSLTTLAVLQRDQATTVRYFALLAEKGSVEHFGWLDLCVALVAFTGVLIGFSRPHSATEEMPDVPFTTIERVCSL